MPINVGIYALWNLGWDGKTVTGTGAEIRYISHFLKRANKVKLFTSVNNKSTKNHNSISDPCLEVVPLPWNSFVSAWLNITKIRAIFSFQLQGLDALYVRLFDPCPWILESLCVSRKIGLVFHIVADPIASIYERSDRSIMGKWIRRGLFFPEEFLTLRSLRSHTVLINGSDNQKRFTSKGVKCKMVISSALENADFSEREDSCNGNLTTILFVGMLRPAKRVEILIEALHDLVEEGRRLCLRIVGSGDPNYTKWLKTLAKRLGLEERVEFAGYVPMGEALNSEYRRADIFAFPSANEGSSRSLLEAAANALPIVCTDVGSSRDLFIHEESALIIPKNDSLDMIAALRRFMDDPVLRRKCIANARISAQGRNVESYVGLILDHLEEARCR